MLVDNVVAAIVRHSGKGANRLSAELGRTREYVRNATGKTSTTLATVADIADVAECDVCIIDRETGAVVATVTPPRRAAD